MLCSRIQATSRWLALPAGLIVSALVFATPAMAASSIGSPVSIGAIKMFLPFALVILLLLLIASRIPVLSGCLPRLIRAVVTILVVTVMVGFVVWFMLLLNRSRIR